MKTPVVLVLASILFGCLLSSQGVARRKKTTLTFRPDGSISKKAVDDSEIILPESLQGQSNIGMTDTGVAAIIAPVYPPPVPDIVAETTAQSGGYLAAVFAALAIGFLIARFTWFPIIPLVAPVACAGASVTFFMLPTLIDRYSLEIMLVGAGIVVWTIYEGWHQRKLHKADPPKKKEKVSGPSNPI